MNRSTSKFQVLRLDEEDFTPKTARRKGFAARNANGNI